VQYLTIGGSAVALHGYERMSKKSSGEDAEVVDLDFWYNPTYDNYFRLLNALERLGQDVGQFREERVPDPKRSFSNWSDLSLPLIFCPWYLVCRGSEKYSPQREQPK
jgi:hypothetical protein